MTSEVVKILVATMSGTAEMVAEEVAAALQAHALPSRILMMDDVDAGDLVPGEYLVCSSTYGTGEVPDNGKALLEALLSRRPDLRGVRYGVIGLGDSIYPNTFCFGAKRFDDLFRDLGAIRIGEVLQHDRRSGTYPEDVAVEWAHLWVTARQSGTVQPLPEESA